MTKPLDPRLAAACDEIAGTNYDCRQDGTMPPPYVRAMLESPAALRARADVRMQIARQDRAIGDTWAMRRNEAVAAHMLNRAAAAA